MREGSTGTVDHRHCHGLVLTILLLDGWCSRHDSTTISRRTSTGFSTYNKKGLTHRRWQRIVEAPLLKSKLTTKYR